MSRRERLHDNIREEVKAVARQQMAVQGTAAISLRSIAREMELSAPALYRYFPSREDLITALIVDSFNSQGAAMRAAVEVVPESDPLGRLAAFMLAYRDWALSHPVDFLLTYGNPIPDYQAPDELTSPAAQRSMEVGVIAIEAAIRSGALVPPPEYTNIPVELKARLEAQSAKYDNVSPTTLYMAMMAWGQGHGLVMLELFHHLQPMLGDPTQFYCNEVYNLIKHMGGQPKPLT
jgi:AcrR family transcriptional regulator